MVETAQDAFAAIALLKADQREANFFVLDQIDVQNNIAQPKGQLLPAKSILEYDAKYEPLVYFLSITSYISEEDNFQVTDAAMTIISSSGQLIIQNHQIQGGSLGLFHDKIVQQTTWSLQESIQQIEQKRSLMHPFVP